VSGTLSINHSEYPSNCSYKFSCVRVYKKIKTQLIEKKIHYLNVLRAVSRTFSIESEIKKLNTNYTSHKNISHVNRCVDTTVYTIDYLDSVKISLKSCVHAHKNHVKLKADLKLGKDFPLSQQQLMHCQRKICYAFAEMIYKTYNICQFIICKTQGIKVINTKLLLCGNLMNMGFTCFQAVSIRKKKCYYKLRVQNQDIPDDEKKKIRTKLFHLKNKMKSQNQMAFDSVIINTASIVGSLLLANPSFCLPNHLKMLKISALLATELINLKNLHLNIKLYRQTNKKIKKHNSESTQNELTRPIYEFRNFSLKNKRNNEIIVNIFRSVMLSAQQGLVITMSISTIVGALHLLPALTLLSSSLFVISHSVEIFQLFKQIKKNESLHKQAKDAVDGCINTPPGTDLKRRVAKDFKMIDKEGYLCVDLIDKKQTEKWLET